MDINYLVAKILDKFTSKLIPTITFRVFTRSGKTKKKSVKIGGFQKGQEFCKNLRFSLFKFLKLSKGNNLIKNSQKWD